MGIKSLNPFLEKNCPAAFINLPYNSFKGKKVAVDCDNVFYKIKCRAYSSVVNRTDLCIEDPNPENIWELFLQYLYEEIEKYCKYGILLIFVFDGKYIDEKSETQRKRKAIREKTLNTYNQYREEVRELDELERTSEMLSALRKKGQNLGSGLSATEKEIVINLLKSLGFPVLQATEEGEKLCAMLCIEGYVYAVYSRDTDVVAMGCPLTFGEEAGWITNPKTKSSEMSLKCTIFKPILAALDMEYLTFLDLCIMSGCDFNSNIPRLGVAKSYKLLKDYKSIDLLPDKYDKTILNYEKCREIFKYQESENICRHTLVLYFTSLYDLPSDSVWHNLKNYTDNFSTLLTTYPTERIERFPSLQNSLLKIFNTRNTLNTTENTEEKEITEENNTYNEYIKQTPSPVRVTNSMIKQLNAQQLERYLNK